MCLGVSVWLGCSTDTTPTQPHRNSNTHRTPLPSRLCSVSWDQISPQQTPAFLVHSVTVYPNFSGRHMVTIITFSPICQSLTEFYVCVAVLLNGSEIWTLFLVKYLGCGSLTTTAVEMAVDICTKWEEVTGSWGELYNEELHGLYLPPVLFRFVKLCWME